MSVEERLEKQVYTLLDGTQIVCFVGGDADQIPVVLLHGGGTDHALLSWRDTIPSLLDAGYRVYAPSYPGYGESPGADQPSTMATLIAYLEVLMDIWKLDKATLVGVSMGGAIALGYALANPDRVDRLVLVGTYGIQDKAPVHRLSYTLVNMPFLIDLLWWMSHGSRWAARYSLRSIIRNPASLTDQIVNEVYEAMQDPVSRETFGQWQRDELRPNGMKTNYTERLNEIYAPVLMVHGTQDFLVPVKYAQRAAARLPNARLEIIDNAGHWTQRDYPDQFNQLLLEFLVEKAP